MTLYLVTVNIGGSHRHYFDSIWVSAEHAEERARQLRDELRRVSIPVAPHSGDYASRWEITVTEARCPDAEIREKRKRYGRKRMNEEAEQPKGKTA